jgi:hypothetical protein
MSEKTQDCSTDQVSPEMTSRDHCARLALEPFVELHFFAGTDKELIKRN